MFYSYYKNKVSISYGITVCNEHEELNDLLMHLFKYIDQNDEVILLQDITKDDPKTNAVIERYKERVKHIKAKLNNDFATFKNNLIKNATCAYLFQIDADELPCKSLLKRIKKRLYQKSDYDCFLVPRVNIVNGLTEAHIQKWKWTVDELNRVNFPDYQFRILKLNGKIKWKYKVHEELYGFEKNYYLPRKNQNYCLMHIKTLEKQEQQNNFYDTLQS
ncbi:glycosyl transferase family 2 [Mucilaginibacter oryzae]|uniref:Glycosyl transferase family 2 n=1 Tax=Mucilaginibacter oryzae TaxID=468058 RepID=A0A316HIS2_9SPHI|nr:glycosyltransferase [Mucilaginibacter oryzae]PWK80207.1 glycosyl transferase family 2 [Mucilaginibacter oryzae]